MFRDFNPRTPCGVRPNYVPVSQKGAAFQSTHPLRGATGGRGQTSTRRKFQSTHPLRGATQIADNLYMFEDISIHAPLAGCDGLLALHPETDADFNPRTPRGVRRSDLTLALILVHFNPRTPCGVRPNKFTPLSTPAIFQSTHPLRGATDAAAVFWCGRGISIHAPLAGCDGCGGERLGFG